MSETSIQIQTQASLVDSSISLDSAGRPMIAHDQSWTREQQAKCKPRFAEFVCNVGEVWPESFYVHVTTIDHCLIGVPLRRPSYKDGDPVRVLGERKKLQDRDAEYAKVLH